MTQELSGLNYDIVIAATKSTTSTTTPGFLDAANITSGMELASEPVSAPGYARMEYKKEGKEGTIAVAAEQNIVRFSETLMDGVNEAPAIIRMSRSYTQMLPNLGYEAVANNLRVLLPCPEDSYAASRYIIQNFFANSLFQSTSKPPKRLSINFVLETERCPVYFSIAEASMRKELEEATTPIVVFSGSFTYALKGEDSSEKLAYMHECIGNWQLDYAVFNDIINNHLLPQNVVEPSYQQVPQLEADNNLYALSAV